MAITLRYRKIFKYTIDEYDHLHCFCAAESEFDIPFSPTRIDLASQEVDIFASYKKNSKSGVAL